MDAPHVAAMIIGIVGVWKATVLAMDLLLPSTLREPATPASAAARIGRPALLPNAAVASVNREFRRDSLTTLSHQ